MSNDAKTETDNQRKWSLLAIAAAALLLMMFGVIAVGTLRGCLFAGTDQAADSGEKKKEEAEKKKKPDFELRRPSCCRQRPTCRCRR